MSITTVQLLHRVGRRARGGDFTALSMAEQGDVIEASNCALQEVYNLAPAYLKEITESFLLPAPQTTAPFSIVQYSSIFGSDIFSETQIGQSILIQGDPAWNQILAPNALLNPYLGQTGTVTATIYGDACFSPRYPFDRIIGNPRFTNFNIALLCYELTRTSPDRGLWPWLQQIGRPLRWWTQMMGNSEGNNPVMVLRVAPAPDQDYVINVRMSYWPRSITFADYTAATTLTVPDQFIEKSLIPIALESLMSTRIWEKTSDDGNVLKRAEDGRAFAKNQLGQIASPNNMVGTPLGF